MYVPPVRDRFMPFLHLPSKNVLGASTIRNPLMSSVAGQVQAGVNKEVQSVQKQLLNVKVSDILSGLQKVGVNVQSLEKFVQTKPTPSATPKPKEK